MVEFARIASAQWAIATRLGPAYQQAKQYGKLPPRVPRLLVPVDLQALVVPQATGSQDRGDIRSRMLDADPEERLPPPFTAAPDLSPGVHLHWAMPDGLTKGRPADPGGTERDLRLRPLPDRWLVCRLSPGTAGKPRPTRCWVLHSDSGFSTPLEKWDPTAAGDPGSTLRPGQFTAAAGGDLGWAAIYDNVVDRLAFHDDLSDLTGPAVLSYVVLGWYADPALDPLHPPTDPAGMTDLLADLGWDADLSSLPEVEASFATIDAQLVGLAEQVGLPPTKGTIGPHVPKAVPGAHHQPAADAARFVPAEVTTSQKPFGIDDLVLNPEITLTSVVKEPRVTSSLYHGTIYGVPTQATGIDERPSAGRITLTMGSTGVDVLSKLLAGNDAVQERMLDAFSYGTLRDYASDDGIVAHDEAVHRHGFAVLPDPGPGVTEKVRDPSTEAPKPPALGGKKADHTVGLGTKKSATFSIGFAKTWQDAQQLTLAAEEAKQGLTFTKDPTKGPGGGPGGGGGPGSGGTYVPSSSSQPTYTKVVRPNPRWYAPTEPVLAIRGANRSQRHGYDGRFDPGELLACRLSSQPVRGYADLLRGRDLVAPLGHGGLPAECDELVREAALSDPDGIDHMSSLVSPALGWTKTQVKNRLAAEMALDKHLQARQGDAGELKRASLREGIEVSPVGVTYWRQPWVPIYAEWTLTLATADTAIGWELGEIDLDPRVGSAAPQLGTRTLAGRSLLNSSSARNLATAVDQFLAAESAADQAGTGILSDSDASDLSTLALTASRADVLVGSLTGINDHFLGFDTDAAFAKPEDDDPITSPARLPQPMRAGWVRMDTLRLVDAYGRTLDLKNRLSGTALADALETTTIPAGVAATGSSPPAHLPPRFSTMARMQLRFVDAADDSVDARVDESTRIVDRNPVAGWLLPDHGDDALEFFDATGESLGQLFHRGFRSAVTWEGAPGRPGPLGAGPAGDLAGSEHLARLAVALVQRDANERASGQQLPESPLGALLRAVDTTLWSADPVGSAGTAPVSVLVGRPIAVVRIKLRLELYDDSHDYALSPADVNARAAAFAAAAERGVTVRLGALSRFDDGVLGCYVDDDYSVFHPILAAVRELARKGGPQQGFLDQVGAAAAYGDVLTADPIVVPYLQGDPELTVRPGRDTTLTVLTLAGLGMNATAGVVPRKRLELNRSWTDAALQKIVPSFRVGPVLVDPAQIRMPRISAVPDDTEGGVQTTWTRRDTPVTWKEDPIVAATMAALLVDRPAVANEGYVRFVLAEDD